MISLLVRVDEIMTVVICIDRYRECKKEVAPEPRAHLSLPWTGWPAIKMQGVLFLWTHAHRERRALC